MKILIVEDDTLLLQGLILAAQTEGYACDGVTTARMAEQSLEAGHYSLVVLDLGLPDEDGLHFLARIRQKKYTLPVLILTARDTLTDLFDAPRFGPVFRRFLIDLQKPVQLFLPLGNEIRAFQKDECIHPPPGNQIAAYHGFPKSSSSAENTGIPGKQALRRRLLLLSQLSLEGNADGPPLFSVILHITGNSRLLTFFRKYFKKAARDFYIAVCILSQINRAEIVVIGIAQTFVFVKNRIVKGGKRADLILQARLQIQRVHIDSVRKNNMKLSRHIKP